MIFFIQAMTEPHGYLVNACDVSNNYGACGGTWSRALLAVVTQMENKRIKLTKRRAFPEARGIRPYLDAMKGVVNMILDDAVYATDGSVVTVEATVHGLVWRGILAIRRCVFDRNGGSGLSGEHCLLGFKC